MKKRVVWKNTIKTVGLFICIISGLFSNSYANDKASKFITTFENFKKNFGPTSKAWLSPASPWAPYFKTITTQKGKKDHLSLEQQGRCDEVMSNVLKNVINQAPKLSTIFLKPEILDNFETTLVPALSIRYQRCQAWQKLIYVIERSKRKSAFSDAPYLNLPYFSFDQKTKELQEKQDQYFYDAVKTLTQLGLCKNDKTALKDLENLSTKMYNTIFNEAQSLYMDAHAKRQGLETNHYKLIKVHLTQGKTKHREEISYQPQKVLSMKARLEAGQWEKASELVPSLTAVCK